MTQLQTDISIFLDISGKYINPLKSFQEQKEQFEEEIKELVKAMGDNNTTEIVDGIGDCNFVLVTLELILDRVVGTSAEFLQEELDECTAAFKKLLKQLPAVNQAFIDEVTREVTNSNLTKFDTNQNDVTETVKHYVNLGVETVPMYMTQYDLYYVVSIKDQTDYNGKTYHKGKILKSKSRYKEPDFTQLKYMYLLGESYVD